jgi:putative hydrolase of the HAD superfamily
VVFDLGGVVFTWQPDQIIKGVFADRVSQEKVKAEIFDHPDWASLDKGLLDREEVIERGAMRTKLPKSKIRELMQQIPNALNLIPDTVKLIRSVKRAGNKVFVLSNMHFASIEHLEQNYAIWDIFDGIVISCRIHTAKPEAEIYAYLLDQYGLSPSETIFIDDTEINLMAAAKLGITTIKFANPSQCESALKDLGSI